MHCLLIFSEGVFKYVVSWFSLELSWPGKKSGFVSEEITSTRAQNGYYPFLRPLNQRPTGPGRIGGDW